MKVEMLPIAKIRTDGGTQPRAALDHDAIEAYADAMRIGAKFPAVDVFYDGAEYWLAHGFHRIKATFAAGFDQISVNIHQGTVEDAQWFSFATNKDNGLYRSNADKQRAVKAALQHPKGANKTDSAIAKHVGVDHQTVANWRAKLESTCEIRKSESRTGRDGRTINTANIGRSKSVSTTVPVEDNGNGTVAAGKSHRQNQIQHAVKMRMVEGLARMRGLCTGLRELNVGAIRGACTTQDIHDWVTTARWISTELRKFSSELNGEKEARQ